MAERRLRLLILGGTGEAAALARRVNSELGQRVLPITSLAGRLPDRPDLPGQVRVGGFGGADGLATYLRDERIDLVIDATHPFAAAISTAAAAASAACGVPRLMLVRPPWLPQAADHWVEVPSFEAAAAAVQRLARRVFLASGSGGLKAFAALPDVWFLVRAFAAPVGRLPLAAYELLLARPPFSVEGEAALLARHRIEALVCKNSGGSTAAKLVAARAAAIPVVILQRPALPAGETVPDVEAAMQWLSYRL